LVVLIDEKRWRANLIVSIVVAARTKEESNGRRCCQKKAPRKSPRVQRRWLNRIYRSPVWHMLSRARETNGICIVALAISVSLSHKHPKGAQSCCIGTCWIHSQRLSDGQTKWRGALAGKRKVLEGGGWPAKNKKKARKNNMNISGSEGKSSGTETDGGGLV